MFRFLVETVEDKYVALQKSSMPFTLGRGNNTRKKKECATKTFYRLLLPFLSRVYLAKVPARVQNDLMAHYKFVKMAPPATQATWMTEILRIMALDECAA